MKNLKRLLSEKDSNKIGGTKMVKLPSGKTVGMPNHVSDYVEPGAVERKDFNLAVMNEASYQHNYIKESKKRDVYVPRTVQKSQKAHSSGLIKR